MICAVCRNPIPDNLMICPLCTLAKDDAATLDAQSEYFIRVLRGEWEFVTVKDTDLVRHVRMFGMGVDKAFCKKSLIIDRRRMGRVSWHNTDEIEKLCTGCRIEIKRIMRGVIDALAA